MNTDIGKTQKIGFFLVINSLLKQNPTCIEFSNDLFHLFKIEKSVHHFSFQGLNSSIIILWISVMQKRYFKENNYVFVQQSPAKIKKKSSHESQTD